MTTEARRRARTLEARASLVFVIALVFLALLGFARLYTVQQSIQRTQRAMCVSSAFARSNSNRTIRLPLKQAFAYLADLGDRSAYRPGQTPAGRRAALAFQARFAGYAAAVRLLPKPRC